VQARATLGRTRINVSIAALLTISKAKGSTINLHTSKQKRIQEILPKADIATRPVECPLRANTGHQQCRVADKRCDWAVVSSPTTLTTVRPKIAPTIDFLFESGSPREGRSSLVLDSEGLIETEQLGGSIN